MKYLWLRIRCLFGKHGRGKRLKPTDPPHVPGDQNVLRFQCPRCGATWTRKVKAKA